MQPSLGICSSDPLELQHAPYAMGSASPTATACGMLLFHTLCSGYMLKPGWMTSGFCSSGLPQRDARTLRVTVYSAHVHQGKLMGFRKVRHELGSSHECQCARKHACTSWTQLCHTEPAAVDQCCG